MIGRARSKGLAPVDAENAFEEAFVETMVQAVQADGLVPIGAGLRMMAYRILHNKIVDHHRKHGGRRDVRMEGEAGRSLPSTLSPRSDEPRGPSNDLAECLSRLSETQRMLIELLYAEELSTDLIAERFRIKTNSVTVAKRRVLRALNDCLEERT
jgi:RNA polymerase sigma factor (sigma-70 family)